MIRNVPGEAQPTCTAPGDGTGLVDCSNWDVSATLTTTSSWPSGNYLLRIVRADNGSDNQILLIVRADERRPDLVYGTAVTTFQAYNNYRGRSLYTFNSFGSNTVAGTPRAVMVSYDRPYEQPRSGLRDWYPRTELPTVEWLEQQGYDVGYVGDNDLELHPAVAQQGHAYLSPAHDEYWSGGMRTTIEQARDAGVNVFFTGSNEVYWKIRFAPDPLTGAAARLQVCYKTVESGGADPDPSGIATTTWRDPAGPNRPENALSGEMYVGDADSTFFPLVVPALQGADRIWRYTGLERQAPTASASLGSGLVGWEWDARVANGAEPAGLKVLSSSPVSGNLIQNNGNGSVAGTAMTTMVKYRAASGALVLTTGTNHWNWGLARDAFGAGEPSAVIQQATVNVLADMGAKPATPSAGMVVDPVPAGAAPTGLSVVSTGATTAALSWTAVTGATSYNVYRLLAPRESGLPLGTKANVAAVTGTTFTDTSPSPGTQYFYVVTAVSAAGESSPSNEVAATAGGPGSDTTPPSVSLTSPAAGATVSGTVSLAATASDNAVVAGVQFFVDGAPVGGEDTAAPYTASWDTTGVAAGSHTVTARARDAAGNSATSAPVSVTVANGGGGGGTATQLFGTQTIQPSADSEGAGQSEAFRVTGTATGQLATIKVYVDTGSTAAKLVAGVYADSPGHPGTLLGQGSISLPVAAAWNTITLPATVPITSGQTYWVAILGTGGTIKFRDCARCGTASEVSTQTTLSSLPATWTTGGAFRDGPLAAYGLSGTATADTTPPSAPPNARVTAQTTTSLTLAWDAATDNVGVTGYRPYLGTTRQPTTTATSSTFAGLSCGTSYTLGVDAVDAAGNASAPSQVTASTSACPDTTPPGAPPNARVTAETTTSLTLAWDAASDNVAVTGYRPYLGATRQPTTTATSFTFTGLTCGTSYTLAVDAVDGAGNASTQSQVTAATTACVDLGPPTAPANLRVTAAAATSVSLAWDASTDDVGVTGYQLFLGGLQVATSTTTAFTFSGLVCATSYTAGVAATDAAGNVSATTTTIVTTAACPDTTPPTAPPNLRITGTTANSIAVAWDAASDNVAVTGYRVYRAGVSIGTTTGTTFTFTALACGTTYALAVDAIDAAGNASAQSTLSAATPACSTSMLLLGTQTLYAHVDSETAGRAEAFRTTAAASGTLGSLSVYVDAGSVATSLVVGVYTDAAGKPGTLLAQATIAGPAKGAWNAVPLGGGAVATPSTYWIAVLAPSGAGLPKFRDCSGCGASSESAQSNLTALPTTWTQGATFKDGPLSAYGSTS